MVLTSFVFPSLNYYMMIFELCFFVSDANSKHRDLHEHSCNFMQFSLCDLWEREKQAASKMKSCPIRLSFVRFHALITLIYALREGPPPVT